MYHIDNITQKIYLIIFNTNNISKLSDAFKENALRYIEDLPSDLELGAGLTIKANAERASRQHQPVTLPDEAAARESAVDQLLLDRILDYFNSHTFEFHIPSDTMRGLQRSMDEEGRF